MVKEMTPDQASDDKSWWQSLSTSDKIIGMVATGLGLTAGWLAGSETAQEFTPETTTLYKFIHGKNAILNGLGVGVLTTLLTAGVGKAMVFFGTKQDMLNTEDATTSPTSKSMPDGSRPA